METKRTELPGRAAVSKKDQTHERLIPGEPGVVRVNSSNKNSTELCKRMFEEFDIPLESYPKDTDTGSHEKTVYDYLKSKNMPGHQAQHIIPIQMSTHPVIQGIGMDMNHPQNGIPLPEPSDAPHALTTHKGGHDVYNAAIKEKLDDIWNRYGDTGSIYDMEKEVFEMQCKLRGALQNGMPLYKKKPDSDGYKNPSKKENVSNRGGGATVEFWRKILNE